jgi:hypothetical protein
MERGKKQIEREWIGVDDAELLTGRSKWTWRQDAYRGRIASSKVGRRLLIPMAEIRRVMEAGLRPRIHGGR